jgi:hypothetical protein
MTESIDFRDPQNRKVAAHAITRTRVPNGHIRAEISGHGQYQCAAVSLDMLIDEYWGLSRAKLIAEVKERQGDPEYDTHGLSKIELIMIIAELSGVATN